MSRAGRGIRLLLLCAGVLASVASAQQPRYSVRRSAVVPHPAPTPQTGQPLRGVVSVSGYSSTVLVPVEPRESEGANAGLFVARENLGGRVRLRVGDRWDLGLAHERALGRGSMRIASESPPRPEGDAYTFAVGAHYSAPLSESWRLGLALDLGATTAPYFEQAKCIELCDGVPASWEETGRHSVFHYSFSLLPSTRAGPWTFFGGLTVENHPTNTKIESQTLAQNGSDDDDELRSGPAYYLLGAGAQLELGRGFAMMAQVFQPLSRDVAAYGPAVGAGISFEFGDWPGADSP